jgi:tetratricopeptide (TPR) repeat protein
VINKSKIIKDAQKFVAKAQWDKAIAEYEKILSDSPSDANTHNTVGDLYLKKNDQDRAIISYIKAAEIFNKSGFTLKSIALYKKVLNIKPDQIDIMLIMGKMNAERGLIGNANENYLAAAAYFSRQGQKARAIDIYKTLCDLNPENLSIAQNLAELYISEGFEEEGVAKYIELAESKLGQGDLVLARDLLEKASHKGSERIDFIRVAASLDMKSNRMPEAVSRLERIIDVNPDARVTSLLAEAYLGTGRYDKSAGLYLKLLEAEPGNIPYRLKLVSAYLGSGEYDTAWKESRALVESHIARSEFDEARRLLGEFLAHKPDSVEARQQLADICSKTGHEEETTRLHMEMADLYSASGDTEKAVNIYRELLAKNPDDESVKAKLSSVSATALEQTALTAQGPADIVDELFQPPAMPDIISPETPPAPPWLEESSAPMMETAAEEGPDKEISAAQKIFELIKPGQDDTADAAGDVSSPETVYDISAPGQDDMADAAEDVSSPGTIYEISAPGQDDAADMAGDVSAPGTVYELPEEPAGLPPFDLGAGGEEESPQETEANIVELQEVGPGGLDDLDIFGSAGEDEHVPGETPSVQVTAGEGLADSLAEIDVYISCGLIDKAMTALTELEGLAPANPELMKRRIEVCKSLGDVDGFVDASVELARTYAGMGFGEEARKAIRKAQEIDPYDERLGAILAELSPAEAGTTETPEVTADVPAEPSQAEAGIAEKPEVIADVPAELSPAEAGIAETPEIPTDSPAEPSLEHDTDSHAATVFALTEHAASLTPGSIIYLEELAEADFYAQQGLTVEAGEIYRRLIETNPDDPGLISRYEALARPVEEPVASDTPVASAEEPALEHQPEEPASYDIAAPSAEEPALENQPEEPATYDIMEPSAEVPVLESQLEELTSYDIMTPPVEEPTLESQLEELTSYDNMAPPAEEPALENKTEETAPEIPAAAPSAAHEDLDKELENQLDAAFGELDLDLQLEDETGAEPDGDFFDLAAELKDELDETGPLAPAPTGSFTDKHLEEVFLEFKKGVEEQLDKEDYETHYNLGIAYKEMGMINEALGEFVLAARDPSRGLDCASMRGLCYIEKGEYDEAIREFKAGLDIEGLGKNESMGLRYDLATAYELKGDIAAAQGVVNGLSREDEGFRDVKERLRKLNKAMLDLGIKPGPDQPGAPPKKSKVSYL